MTISTVSTSTSSAPSSGGTVNVAQLQKQIQALTKQITTEQNSKDDDKTKAQVIQALELQIQALEMQIQQAQQQAEAKQTQAANTTQQQTVTDKTQAQQDPLARNSSRWLDTQA